MSSDVDFASLAAELARATPADPYATARALRRIAERAARGNRLDDVVRGHITIVTGFWLLARLVAAGRLAVTVDGWVRGAGIRPEAESTRDLGGATTAPARGPDGGLLDAAGSNDLIDWTTLSAVIAARPFQADPAWHQSFDTLASLRRRLALMEYFNDLSGAKVLQLGDDELFGLALGMVDDVRGVHVVDADPAVLAYIAAEAALRRLPVTTQRADLRAECPDGDDFDTFYVSGLKDAGGLRLFTVAAMAASRPGAAGYVSFDTAVYRAGMDEPAVLRELGRVLERLDCAITAHVPCEDRLMTDEMLADLAALVNLAARPEVTVAEIGARLRRLADAQAPDGFYLKPGYPAIPLRSAGLVRVRCGAESRRLARRDLIRLRRLANAPQMAAVA